ncbi:MAG: hypothetical protein ACM3SY_16905 [Candidatus Omnitrophota bacterium]
MSETKVFDQLNPNEMSNTIGGIPYEKPIFLSLADPATSCGSGSLCFQGTGTTCADGSVCAKGSSVNPDQTL